MPQHDDNEQHDNNEDGSPTPISSPVSTSSPISTSSYSSIYHSPRLNNSVFRIETNHHNTSTFTPWRKSTSTSTGTLTAIRWEGKMILVTNHHVVHEGYYFTADINNESVELVVTWIDPVLDLAILDFKEIRQKQKIEPFIEPLDLHTDYLSPETPIIACGFANGDEDFDKVSGNITKHLITACAHSNLETLHGQTTAPINKGSSGGPIVFVHHDSIKCAGIISSTHTRSQNVGYFIPGGEILRVLKRAHKYSPVYKAQFIEFYTDPVVEFTWQSTDDNFWENLANHYNMGLMTQSGIRVCHVPGASSAYGILQEDDILLSIQERSIYRSGRIKCKIGTEELLLPFQHIIHTLELLSTMDVTVLRKENEAMVEKRLSIPLNRHIGQSLLGLSIPKPSQYYVAVTPDQGAFVFTAATKQIIEEHSCPAGSHSSTFNDMQEADIEKKHCQIVILAEIIPSKSTQYYTEFLALSHSKDGSKIIKSVNGELIADLHDLARILERSQGKVVSIKLANNKVISAKLTTSNEAKEQFRIKHGISLLAHSQAFIDSLSSAAKDKVNKEATELFVKHKNNWPISFFGHKNPDTYQPSAIYETEANNLALQ